MPPSGVQEPLPPKSADQKLPIWETPGLGGVQTLGSVGFGDLGFYGFRSFGVWGFLRLVCVVL